MPTRPLNRRRFLGCSAAAGLALAHGPVADAETAPVLAPTAHDRPINLGLIGLGNRGTTLLRTAIAAPGVKVTALFDTEPNHLNRAQKIAEKADATQPAIAPDLDAFLSRDDLDAVFVAPPCDLHADVYTSVLQAGKHLYAEKPLGLSSAECDRVVAAAAQRPDRIVHVGLQRRFNPRFVQGIERAGELGTILNCRGSWLSRHEGLRGHNNWLSFRERSGDWMVEQAIHVWDLLCWLKGGPPAEAYGHGERSSGPPSIPGRNVTDFYSVTLAWPDGFSANFVHSWKMPVDDHDRGMELVLLGSEGVLYLTSGYLVLPKNNPKHTKIPTGPIPDTDLAVRTFLNAIRDPASTPASIATLADARRATQVGFLVRQAVDDKRLVRWDEVNA